jgi:hypothetical protein
MGAFHNIILSTTVFQLVFCFNNLFANQTLKVDKTIVSIGLNLIYLGNIDVREQTFDAEFYLNLKWKGTRTARNFELLNVKNYNRSYFEEWVERDTNWITCKITGTFRSEMDVTQYPIDDQTLSIKIGDYVYTSDSLEYIINKEIDKPFERLSLFEWKIKKYNFQVIKSLEFQSQFSVVEYSIDVYRKPGPFIIKVLIPILIIIGVSFLTLFLTKEQLEACIAIGITTMLSLIALHFSISNHLPDVNYPTKIDLLMMGSYFLIFLILAEVVIAHYYYKNGHKIISFRLDKYSRWILALAYIIFLLLLFTPIKFFSIYYNY